MPVPVTPVVTLLRLVGFAEGWSCAALFLVAMPLKYAAGMPQAVRIIGAIHGGLFLAFLAVLVLVMVRRRWAVGRGLLAVVAAVVPFGTFLIDRRLRAWDLDPSGVIAAHGRLGDALRGISAWIASADRVAPAVSAWPIAQHLDHVLRAQVGIDAVLDGSAPAPPVLAATRAGRVLLAIGWIPRGRGRAPPSTQPQPVDAAALTADLATALRRHAALTNHFAAIAIDPSLRAHPAFGGLTRAQWLRFASIHVHHHLRIVRDIARRA